MREVIVRVRERGREFTAEAHVVPPVGVVDVAEVSKASERARGIDPRLAEVTLAPLADFPRT
jgi:hypothetical protein